MYNNIIQLICQYTLPLTNNCVPTSGDITAHILSVMISTSTCHDKLVLNFKLAGDYVLKDIETS